MKTTTCAKRTVALVVAFAILPAGANGQSAEADLTRLIYTATGPLSVSLVSPKDGDRVKGTMPIEVSTQAGAGVELSLNGTQIPFSQIGERSIKSDGSTHYVYYGISFHAGSNDIAIAPIGAGSNRGKTEHAFVFGPGIATAIGASISSGLQADGITAGVLRVALLDAAGQPAAAESVRATIVSGDVTLGTTAPTAKALPLPAPTLSSPANVSLFPATSATSLIPSTQFEGRTDDTGHLEIPIVPGLTSSEVSIQVATASGVSTIANTFVQPHLRAAFVNGLVTGGIGAMPGVPGEDAGSPDGLDSRRARVAIFGTGQVFAHSLLTVAYDTANVLDQTSGYGPFTANPDERPYLTYGDASTRRDDALSRDHLFASLVRGNTSLMWGEFLAKTGSESLSSIGGLSLLVNGAKLETGNASSHVAIFQAKNNVAYGRQTFTPTGLATLTTPLHPDIVVGSDIVDLVSIDRHTGIVLSETTLTNNVDYVLDYATGYLRFVNVPLPFDENFNPQQVLVRYQYQGLGSDAETTGGRASTTFGKRGQFNVGAGYANNAEGSGNVSLLSEHVGGNITGGTWSVEHMATRGQIGTTDPFSTSPTVGAQTFGDGGDAWKADLAASRGANNLNLDFTTTSAGFNNPFGGLSTPGLVSYRAAYSHAIADGSIDAAIDHDSNAGVGYQNSQTNASFAAKKRISRMLTVGVGIAQHRYVAGSSFVGVPTIGQAVNPIAAAPVLGADAYSNPNGSVTQLAANADYKISPAIDIAVSKLLDIAGSADAITSSPSETSAELGVSFDKKGRAYIREMWNGSPNQAFAASSVPLTTQSTGTRSTAIGFERMIGTATTVDSEYVLQNSASGSDVYSAIGVKQDFTLHGNLKGSVNAQRANAIGAGLSGFNVYGLTLAYANGPIKGTGSYQMRTGDVPGSTLSLGTAGAITPSISLIASLADANTVGFSSNQDRLSIAIRPQHDDNSMTLLGYTRESGNDAEIGDRTQTLSIEQMLRPSRKLDLSGRVAYKLDGDSYYQAHTYLLGARADEKIGGPNSRLDFAIDGRYLGASGGVVGASAFGYAGEFGMTIGNAMRVGVGYNFAAAPDPNLAIAPTHKGVYATFTSTVNSLLGWGKSR